MAEADGKQGFKLNLQVLTLGEGAQAAWAARLDGAGSALLTATVHGASATLTVSVSAPIRPAASPALVPCAVNTTLPLLRSVRMGLIG